ncbi:MAG: N-acetyltransferase [Dissulfurimicrobium sp.]|uniref:N-acetyltransferase n=1 Tax=Dissulfurimicrobium TaxID=1769732 RepID=UPI001EDC56B4|nr:N-acetyltransferase [Dissulfurimicrobium hydrothermale]UKL14056.1 N-acetyltransferase [Dissulfurimicrobium hydrothermale]
MIRKAEIGDIKAIHALLSRFAEKSLLLPRSLSELYSHLRDYTVFEAKDCTIKGVAALHIVWDDLAEVRSLAVDEEYQKHGIGRELVRQCLSEAKALGIHNVFTLTYQPDFFEKLGFKPVDKTILPHKIWADCVRCPKFPDCDESALLIEL